MKFIAHVSLIQAQCDTCGEFAASENGDHFYTTDSFECKCGEFRLLDDALTFEIEAEKIPE